jgi:hypothetical protein
MSNMSDSKPIFPLTDSQVIASMRAEIEKAEASGTKRPIEKFVLAALSSIPWIGSFVSAAASLNSEDQAHHQNYLQMLWVEEHQRKLIQLARLLEEIRSRFESLGSAIDERIQSEGYLLLVRKAFRSWDNSDTEDKRRMLGNVVTNAGGTRACPDDVIRLFLDWIELYNEVHFAVIREIFHNPGSTRFEIWSNIYGDLPREDSAEADLYKFLIRDLSTGGVIRQERDVNSLGQYTRKKPIRRRGTPTTLESAFEDTKPYVLTKLGGLFVHYTMNEAVTRLSGENSFPQAEM